MTALELNIALFVVTLAGGCLPLFRKSERMPELQHLLAFSGSFLLGITLLHLVPESFAKLGEPTGIWMLAGFFFQLMIQRFTHGAEHGHAHLDHHHPVSLIPLLAGLCVHAFMEGLPLGFEYYQGATIPSLYLAVGVHKIPEAMLVVSLLVALKGRRTAALALLFFAAISPLASALGGLMHDHAPQAATLSNIIPPLVAGAFIHIATTIFYESGTRQHLLTFNKAVAMAAGVLISLLTLLIH